MDGTLENSKTRTFVANRISKIPDPHDLLDQKTHQVPGDE